MFRDGRLRDPCPSRQSPDRQLSFATQLLKDRPPGGVGEEWTMRFPARTGFSEGGRIGKGQRDRGRVAAIPRLNGGLRRPARR